MTLDALDRMAYAAVALTAAALADVAGPELTFLGWRALVVLGSSDGPVRLSDLAARLGLSRPSASRLVRRLERRGLVSLSPNPDDRRGLLIALSAAGERVRADVVTRRRHGLAEALDSPLPERFDEGLRAVADRLDGWI